MLALTAIAVLRVSFRKAFVRDDRALVRDGGGSKNVAFALS